MIYGTHPETKMFINFPYNVWEQMKYHTIESRFRFNSRLNKLCSKSQSSLVFSISIYYWPPYLRPTQPWSQPVPYFVSLIYPTFPFQLKETRYLFLYLQVSIFLKCHYLSIICYLSKIGTENTTVSERWIVEGWT